MPERKRSLGRVSVLFNSHSNTKSVSSGQAFKHPPKAVDRQCSKVERDGGHMFPMFSSTRGLISPTSSFSALSHSSSPRAAALCHHHLPHCTTHLPHKVSQASSQHWKCSSDAACCHGHHTLGRAVPGPGQHIHQLPAHTDGSPSAHDLQSTENILASSCHKQSILTTAQGQCSSYTLVWNF